MRGGESRCEPMEDERQGVEEREIDETERGGEGAGRQHIYKKKP